MKYIIIIILLLSSIHSNSKTRDINVYGTLGGYTTSIEFAMEYNLLNTKMLGIETTTYFKFGASMFGFYDVILTYSYPVIGFVQFFGKKEGLDLGANYFNRYYRDLLDKSLPRELRVPSRLDVEAIGFELGYRFYDEKTVYRFTYNPAFILSSDDTEKNEFTHSIGLSIGYSF